MTIYPTCEQTLEHEGKEYECRATFKIEIKEWKESRGEHFGTPCREIMRETVNRELEDFSACDTLTRERVDNEDILSALAKQMLEEHK